MISTARTRSKKVVLTCSLLLSVAVLPACSSDDADPVDPQETSAVGGAGEGEVCPAVLPPPELPGDGLGTQEPAATAPSLPAPEAASVCLYDPTETEAAEGEETTYSWTLSSAPVPVGARDLKTLTQQLTELTPADPDATCPAKVRSRWLLVYTVGDDATGVAVDDFGCQDVRLTDEPFETAPGDATQEGTVSGVLSGPTALLNQIKLAWING